MVIRTLRRLPVPGLLFQPSKPGRPHLLCPLHQPGWYAPHKVDDRTRPLTFVVWQWDQLRLFKVGGNESATKFFQTNGGTAALASKDVKVKYTSNAANKYKEELKRRAVKDSQEWVPLSAYWAAR